MFTKIVDVFSLMVFSTTTVLNDLPIIDFDGNSYSYGQKDTEHLLGNRLESTVFDKPVYFLWDLNTFLARGDLYFSVSKDNDFSLNIYEFPDCKFYNTSSPASTGKIVSTLTINSSIYSKLSNNLLLAYRFSDKILTLGLNSYLTFSFNSLFDYYKSDSDYNSMNFLIKFLISFMDYNCLTGVSFSSSSNGVVYLVPKWNNLSGINLRYFYLSEYHHIYSSSVANIGMALLSVDLKQRYVKNNLLIYPVLNGSYYMNIKFGNDNNYYRSNYVNLFSTGLSNSFSYNTIILQIPFFLKKNSISNSKASVIRFMNFSMLDATSITGGNPEGNTKGWGVFDVVNSQSCVWYDVFCHITAAVGGVMNNIIGFKQLSKLVNLFFTPMSITLKIYQKYNVGLGDLPLISPVIVSGAMLLVLFNFYRRFK